ncbi:hypothetical protein HK101_005082, partial [Irineochytrium annulatum]
MNLQQPFEDDRQDEDGDHEYGEPDYGDAMYDEGDWEDEADMDEDELAADDEDLDDEDDDGDAWAPANRTVGDFLLQGIIGGPWHGVIHRHLHDLSHSWSDLTTPALRVPLRDLHGRGLTRLLNLAFGRVPQQAHDKVHAAIMSMLTPSAPVVPFCFGGFLRHPMHWAGWQPRIKWSGSVKGRFEEGGETISAYMLRGMGNSGSMATNAPEDWGPDWNEAAADARDQALKILVDRSSATFVVASNPLQWSNSPSNRNHGQRANSLALLPPSYVTVVDDPAPRPLPPELRHSDIQSPFGPRLVIHQRPLTFAHAAVLRAGPSNRAELRRALVRIEAGSGGVEAGKPDVFLYTRFAGGVDWRAGEGAGASASLILPMAPICCDGAYGYFVVGNGCVAAFSTMGMGEETPPKLIGRCEMQEGEMVNAVSISRRAVYVGDEGAMEYEHCVIASRNEGVIQVFSLPNCKTQAADTSAPADRRLTVTHRLAGFDSAVNDAKLSPDGLHLACVGDGGRIWISRVAYGSDRVSIIGRMRTAGWERDEDLMDTAMPVRVFSPIRSVELGGFVSEESIIRTSMGMLYVSWSCEGTFFAVTSDAVAKVLVCDVRDAGKVVYEIDAG